MSNIFTQTTSPPFLKQAIDEFFIQPMFMAEDIRGALTVRTNVKGTERLNRISRPSMITKPKTSPGFRPSGSFNLSYSDITVKPMVIEFEQNGRAFWDSILEQLLASGYKEDDVEQMKTPDVWNKIMLPLIAKAGQDDLIRQMFFADPKAEILNTGKPTGVIDENYSGYTGLLTWFMHDLFSHQIPAAQHVKIASSVAAVKQEKVLTYTRNAEDVTIVVTINGVDYAEPYVTNAATTITNWVSTHKANVESRAGVNGVIVTNEAAALKIVSRYKGGEFTAAAEVTEGGATKGTFASGGVVSPVKAGSLASNESDNTLEAMIDAITPEMHEFDLVFMMTSSMWRNLVHTLKARNTNLGDKVLLNGQKVPQYEGFPIIIRPDWDRWIKLAHNGIQPHRATLTTSKNLLFATDGTSDSEMIETWYNQEDQMRRYRVQYKAQTAYLHKELMVLAGFGD